MALKTVKSGLVPGLSHLNAKRSSKEPKNVLNHKSALRIVDANSNRCREGLRVIEDSLRFVLNDGNLYKKIRAIRHSVDKISRNIYGDLIKERDSFSDLGRKIPEVSKKDLQDVMIANFKRVQESLRVLEECSKTFIPLASTEFKKQRYSAYVLEKEVYLKYKKVFFGSLAKFKMAKMESR